MWCDSARKLDKENLDYNDLTNIQGASNIRYNGEDVTRLDVLLKANEEDIKALKKDASDASAKVDNRSRNRRISELQKIVDAIRIEQINESRSLSFFAKHDLQRSYINAKTQSHRENKKLCNFASLR